MQVKTFEALTFRDAVKQIKKEFGQDAVILGTKQKPMGAAGQGNMVEVTAAAPESSRSVSGASRSKEQHASSASLNETIDRISALEAKISTQQSHIATRRQIQSLETGMAEIKLLLFEFLRNKEGSLLHNLPEHIAPIEMQLRLMGISETYTAELLKHLKSTPIPEEIRKQGSEAIEQHSRAQAMRWMLRRLKIAPRWTLMQGSQVVQVFVGASGSGKSALVAKLAAQYHSKEKNKVLVISYDTMRLAAADQMRLYCKIIGVPFLVANEAAEVSKHIVANRDVELILVDTSGRATKSDSAPTDLLALKSADTGADFHLVLSATERDSQLERSIKYFSQMGIQSASFTKLDECWTYGDIFNQALRWSLPLSFFGTGPSVPDDLERATRERVVERIFGL